MKATAKLRAQGQSVWLDNITRALWRSGSLRRYIDELSVTGLTSNPTIFDHAIKNSPDYDADIREKLEEVRRPPTMYEGFNLVPNHFRFRISPEIIQAFGMNVIAREEEEVSKSSEMIACRQPGPDEMDAYERVLGDAMAGDATLFAREDYVEEAWRIVDPVLKAGTPIHQYEPSTWGPAEVNQRVFPNGGWQNPTVTD
jgi:Glucose-6-phosphate dehydrogenase, C-terminal domain/Transaldolase/Fructose-6-phosphate aldolase